MRHPPKIAYSEMERVAELRRFARWRIPGATEQDQ